MAKEFYITAAGLEDLKAKLEYLKTEKRREVNKKIQQAREYGDLSENAEYDAAKEEQGLVEADIRKYEEQIEHAVIIEDSAQGSRVIIGSTVVLYDIDLDEQLEYRIVGATEADINKGQISNECPLAEAVLGKNKGETVEVHAQESYKVKIVDIK